MSVVMLLMGGGCTEINGKAIRFRAAFRARASCHGLAKPCPHLQEIGQTALSKSLVDS